MEFELRAIREEQLLTGLDEASGVEVANLIEAKVGAADRLAIDIASIPAWSRVPCVEVSVAVYANRVLAWDGGSTLLVQLVSLSVLSVRELFTFVCEHEGVFPTPTRGEEA